MPTLTIFRHGNTFGAGDKVVQVGAGTDLSLSDTGLLQAQAAADFVKNNITNPKALYSGPLKRHQQFAQIINQALKLSAFITHPALNELDYGSWEGLTTDEIKAQYPDEFLQWEQQAQWPADLFNGFFAEKIAEIQSFIDEIKQFDKADHLVGVSSGGIIRLFLALMPSKWQQLVETKKLNDYKVKTGHYCQFKISADFIDIIAWNQRP